MATTPGPKAPVAPPVALPPTRSLLQALPPVGVEEGAFAGVSHVEGRGPFVQGPFDWCTTQSITITAGCELAERTSFNLIAGELRPSLSTFAANRSSLDERQASARLNLELHESFVIARELLYGSATVANGWGNPYLTDPAALRVITMAAQPYHVALDRITKRWATDMAGERGLIHASPSVARMLIRTMQVVERGNQLFDAAMGHQLVVDAGYAGANNVNPDGADPLGQVEWIFMSPNIDIRVSPIAYLPATVEEMRFAVAREANTLTVLAVQTVSYTYETPITNGTVPAVLGVPVDLCMPDCIPGAS